MSTLFICIEGVDCVGKTEVAKSLADRLKAFYYKTPGGLSEDERMAVYNLTDPCQRYTAYRAAAARDSQAITNILMTSSVVCDRYIYSTFAMHAAMDDTLASRFEVGGLLIPDHVFLLTADEEVRKRRLFARPHHLQLEDNIPLQNKADGLFKEQGHTIVDTSTTTVDEVVEILLRYLGQAHLNPGDV